MKKKFIILRIIIALTSLFGISAMTYLITSLASFDFNPVNWTLVAKVYDLKSKKAHVFQPWDEFG